MTSEQTPPRSTSSSADTPANPSPSPENEGETPIPAISGRSSLALLAYYDPESSCWRTSQGTFDLDSIPSSLTLPAWGMTRGGELFERVMSAPPTSEPGCSSLLPTPVAQDDQKQPAAHLAKKVDSGAGETITSLTVMTRQYAATGEWSNKLLPTPTTDDANNVTRESGDFQSLARTAHNLLPTPTARDGKGSGNNPERHLAEHRLTGIEHRPTPNGAFTKPPSDGGNESADALLPDQLTIEDA